MFTIETRYGDETVRISYKFPRSDPQDASMLEYLGLETLFLTTWIPVRSQIMDDWAMEWLAGNAEEAILAGERDSKNYH